MFQRIALRIDHTGHLCTINAWGGAEALCLDDAIGTIAPGFDADLVVLDRKARPLLVFRDSTDITEQLFGLMTMGEALRAASHLRGW